MTTAAQEALYSRLSVDATFMAALPGGLHKVWEVGKVDRQLTPSAFSNGEILPCAVIALRSPARILPHEHAVRAFLILTFYQRLGYDKIAEAREQAFTLLNEWKTTGIWDVRWADDVTHGEAPRLKASMEISRYTVHLAR